MFVQEFQHHFLNFVLYDCSVRVTGAFHQNQFCLNSRILQFLIQVFAFRMWYLLVASSVNNKEWRGIWGNQFRTINEVVRTDVQSA